MSFTRRDFLLWSGAAGLLGQSQHLQGALVSPDELDSQALDSAQARCLQTWIETLLPADEVSPGATELGVAERIVGKALGKPDYLKLLHAGCRWLDRQAQARGKLAYAELDVTGRESIVRVAEQSREKSVPLAFFVYTRNDAFGFYYTQPETWGMLGYPGPPQPRGFMDYTRPPAG
jgi:hypothetical protein